ncbi:hypothetical protein BWI97_16360 [Siphonobacter sp. BAB-5405]|nr:hypothetical protein BWI97_16360 [Siphonobacter sp. BAB-5405]
MLCFALLLACSNDKNETVGNWPNLPVKSNLFYFSSGNIQKANLGTGQISNIGGSGDKPDQSMAVDVSRDGSEIAFIYFGYDSQQGKDIREIRVMDTKGKRLSTIPLPESFNRIKISPDKSKFICQSTTQDISVVFDRQGKMITDMQGARYFAWTPDNRIILTSELGSIFLTDASLTAGSLIKKLSSPVREPDVSPDGQRVAFYNAGNVWSMKLDGSDLKQHTTSSLEVFAPSWSADGKHMSVLWSASQERNHLGSPKVFLIPVQNTPVEVSENSRDAIMLHEKWPDHPDGYTELSSRSQAMLR